MPTIHRNYSESRQKGNIGEDIACLFLMKQGFRLLERNYLRPWGEIDIVAIRNESSRGTRGANEVLHFVEVKSVSCEIQERNVSHETIRPEENMTEGKMHRLSRVIKTYLSDKKLSYETPFQVDLITVRYDAVSKIAVAESFRNVL